MMFVCTITGSDYFHCIAICPECANNEADQIILLKSTLQLFSDLAKGSNNRKESHRKDAQKGPDMRLSDTKELTGLGSKHSHMCSH